MFEEGLSGILSKEKTAQLDSMGTFVDNGGIFDGIFTRTRTPKTTRVLLTYEMKYERPRTEYTQALYEYAENKLVDFLDDGVLVEVDFCGMQW